MATTSEIRAAGANTAPSDDFSVDSTPVSVILRIDTQGELTGAIAVGQLMRKMADGEAYQPVDFIEFQGCRRPARFYTDAKELCVVAPGTYRIQPVSVAAYNAIVAFEKAVSA